jgi:Ni,Fe-hydrogenase III large subunit
MGRFRDTLLTGCRDGGRIAALFAGPFHDLWAVLVSREGLLLGRTVVAGDRFPSLTPDLPEVHLFEREIAEQSPLRPEGHPALLPVRTELQRAFFQVSGDQVHEVAVGPVHAGVIEPGHFRFQCLGEEVLHLEIALGYQHRGVEAALRGGKRSLHLAETLAGDTTVAHATAYCELVEGLAGATVEAGAEDIRALALELERLANHTGDLGALAGDVGFLPGAAFCGRLRGDWLNLTAALCGNRFGRGLVVPGGVRFGVPEGLVERARAAMRDLRDTVALMAGTPGVQARFEDTGRLSTEAARSLGLVGVAARASGLARDVRAELPTGAWRRRTLDVATDDGGDVGARARVRAAEAEASFAVAQELLAKRPPNSKVPVATLAPNHVAVVMVEGWRGEVCHAAITDAEGRFAAYKVVDPSFHNWPGLAMALRGQQISDFPLCNKSFNLSYCGFDL